MKASQTINVLSAIAIALLATCVELSCKKTVSTAKNSDNSAIVKMAPANK